ncbi:unnamed protein product [Phytomonas sp. EM1]|nr:unnamed protein product [Phytomonas sp. EM1]|eukprot:CCW61644.1 unnamed protein product [Phytomonas sp. isolate EM1]
MKTVSEWLATSSDDDDDIVNARRNASPVIKSKGAPLQPSSQGYQPSPTSHNALSNTAPSISVTHLPKNGNISTQETVAVCQGEVASEPPPGYRAVEIMVVDRGTQTVSTVGTQTDPFPVNANNWDAGECPTNPWGVPAQQGVPLAHTGGIRGTVHTTNGIPLRNSRRPYHLTVSEVEAEQNYRFDELRHQLELIQNTLDTLISRYNLPPPPFSSLL